MTTEFAAKLGQRDAELKIQAAEAFAGQPQYSTFPHWLREEIKYAFIRGCMCSSAIDAASNQELVDAAMRIAEMQ